MFFLELFLILLALLCAVAVQKFKTSNNIGSCVLFTTMAVLLVMAATGIHHAA